MKLLKNYCEDPSKRYLLNNFSKKVFNLDFSKWERNGFWDPAYKPISLLDNGEIISNVSIYSLEMIINSKKCKVAQLSTVGTLPEHRKKGFGKKIIFEAIKILEKNHELIFLFADVDAVKFYQTLGFTFILESKFIARIPNYQKRKGLRQLDMNNKNDLMKLHKYAQKRISVSDVIGILNENLLMFHGLHTLTNHIYLIPDLDIIIIYKIIENKLVLFDIIGRYIPKPADLFPYIIDENITEVEFHFVPDKLDLTSIRIIDFKENQLHIMGAFPFTSEKFIFPYTSHA